MRSIRKNYEGVILFDILPHGQTINSEYCCDLFKWMKSVLRERYHDILNRKRVILQQNNARPHTLKMIRDKIKELDGIELYPILLIVQTLHFPINIYLDLLRISDQGFST